MVNKLIIRFVFDIVGYKLLFSKYFCFKEVYIVEKLNGYKN